MTYHSHVLNIPHAHPFDNEHRWTTFLGEFVRPLVAGKDFLFWFSYYTDFAKLRIYTDDYDSAELDALMLKFGLTYELNDEGSRKEHPFTLEEDLGSPRFLGAERTDVSPTERGLMVLKLAHAGAQLFLSTLVRDGAYWREEICVNPNNPYNSASRSYIHLCHNMAQSGIQVVSYMDQNQKMGLLCEYAFSHEVRYRGLRPIQTQRIRLDV